MCPEHMYEWVVGVDLDVPFAYQAVDYALAPALANGL
jgi:hypothetical protein